MNLSAVLVHLRKESVVGQTRQTQSFTGSGKMEVSPVWTWIVLGVTTHLPMTTKHMVILSTYSTKTGSQVEYQPLKDQT